MSGGVSPIGGGRRAFVVAALAMLALSAAIPAVATRGQAIATTAPPRTAEDFPDPFVLKAGGSWYAFATNGLGNVPVRVSSDLLRWPAKGDALPVLGPWADPGETWAPAVVQRGGLYVLFYTAKERWTHLQCIGRAVSALPEGPYTDLATAPLVCQRDRGGSIDPSVHVEGARAWLYWKSEGIAGREPSRIWGAELGPDALSGIGPAVELLRADLPWEGGVVEGPSMAAGAGKWFLLYSGNRWQTASYAVGFARCAGPLGPCRKGGGPILASGGHGLGPGGQEAFTDGRGTWWLAYHAWNGPVGYPAGVRALRVEKLDLSGERPVVR